jgi:hypothetical protein
VIPMGPQDINRQARLLEDASSRNGERTIQAGVAVRIIDYAKPLLGGGGPGTNRVCITHHGQGAIWTSACNVELIDETLASSLTGFGERIKQAIAAKQTTSPYVKVTYNANIHGGTIQSYVDRVFSNGPHISLDLNREVTRDDLIDMSIEDAKTIRRLLDLAIAEAEGEQK